MPSLSAGTFDDLNDRVIQFGYLVLFAPAFPLAPFFAFINNVVEIRADANKLIRVQQRPFPKVSSGIGVWNDVFQMLLLFSIATNTGIALFTSKFGERCTD